MTTASDDPAEANGDDPGARGPVPAIRVARRPVAMHTVASTDGVSLALHDLGGAGPPLVLCHPTGFHALIWAPVAAELNSTHHVWAVDLRGHGDSSLPTTGSLDWDGMADDVLATLDYLDDLHDTRHLGGSTSVVAAGHSMGGAALLGAEATRPGLFASLWLFEPIVFPPVDRSVLPANPLAAAARRRTATFDSREAALANYAAKAPLANLHADALAAYVRHGFRDLPDGRVGLKCQPETEAQIFEGAVNNGVFGRLDDVKCPVTVAASGDGGYPAQGAELVAETLPDSRLERFDELTHFGPMEDPSAIARSILATVG